MIWPVSYSREGNSSVSRCNTPVIVHLANKKVLGRVQKTFDVGCLLIIKANKMHSLSALFGKELYMFRADLPSISGSLNAVFIKTGICHIMLSVC